MRRLLFTALCSVMLLCATTMAQTASSTNAPYRNLAVWYGTQSAPTLLEKAMWALDDINEYRKAQGLTAFSETILDSADHPKQLQKRHGLFRRFR